MTASELFISFKARGINLRADGNIIHLDAVRGVLTDADRDAVLALKPQMLELINRPPPGSFRCPRTARGIRLTDCPWPKCGGKVGRVRTSTIYLCAKCGNYFELLPEE